MYFLYLCNARIWSYTYANLRVIRKKTIIIIIKEANSDNHSILPFLFPLDP